MNQRDALYLGIDGGGTATRAVIVDAGGVVRGRGAAGGANQEVIGSGAAVAAVRAAAQRALAEARAEPPVRAAWIGLAGVDAAAAAETLRPALSALADELRITNDGELLLGALPGDVGVALIAGTGSIALGRNAVGATARAGGWGHIFGDEGSGYALGVASLNAVARAADGRGEPTVLTSALLRTLEVAAPSALIARVHEDWDKAEIARLASLVVAAAEAGDRVALAILRRGANELAGQARAVARSLALAVGAPEGAWHAPLPLALGGGLLLEAPTYRALVLEALGGERACAPVVLVPDAALVAARGARTMVAVPEEEHLPGDSL